MGLILHLNGYPGTGKLTIARGLARILGARVIDNHTLLNPVNVVYDRSDPARRELRADIRALVFRHVAALPPDTNLIFTDAFSDHPEDRAIFDQITALADQRGDMYRAFVLTLTAVENARRLTDPARTKMHKLTDSAILADLRSRHALYVPDRATCLDVTDLSADQAAEQIAQLAR